MIALDHEEISDILRDCAEKFVLPRYEKLLAHEISTKTGPNDLVTQADIDVENALKETLPRICPGSVVIGEEGVSSGTASLAPLKNDTGLYWVVDPVDGTYNFVHGKREFAIMLALVENGRTRAGWIYDVLSGGTTWAEAGRGAWRGDKRLSVSLCEKAADAKGHISRKYWPRKLLPHLETQKDKVAGFSTLSCAAHEYMRVASGAVDFAVYTRLKAWDHLAGVLMVQEAGGHVAKWDGTPYMPGDDGGGLIAAANEELWRELRGIFVP